MPSRIALVTDSTSQIPPEWVAERGISVVPVEVIINGLAYSEGVDISSAAITAAMYAHEDVSTSRPAPSRFLDAYRQAAAGGAEQIVSAHLSAELSGTYQSALLAATDSPVPVEVVDSRTVSMGLGFAVLSGSDVARAGGSVADVVAAIKGRAGATRVLLYVDTLEYLRRGGRIGAASALLGNVLRMKPILTVRDGVVTPLEKTRTSAKALTRLAELAIESAGRGDVDICVQDLDTIERNRELAETLAFKLPSANITRGSVGAVVGSHVGPGALAVIVAARSW